MKKLLKIAALAGLVFTMASCGTANDAYGNNRYPAGNGGVFRTPDGGTYRTGEVYRDRNGNVYENGRVVRTGDVYGRPGILGRNNTVYYPQNNARRLPPGQAKKIYGGSAKDYAPGQMKKSSAPRADIYKKGKHDHRKNAVKIQGKNGKKNGKK